MSQEISLEEPTQTDKLIARLVLDYCEKMAVNEAYCEMLRTDPSLVEECQEYRELVGPETECAEVLPVGVSISLLDIINEYVALQTIMKQFMSDLPAEHQLRVELSAANSFQKKLQFILKLFKGNLEAIEYEKAMGLPDYVSEYIEDIEESSADQDQNNIAPSPQSVNLDEFAASRTIYLQTSNDPVTSSPALNAWANGLRPAAQNVAN